MEIFEKILIITESLMYFNIAALAGVLVLHLFPPGSRNDEDEE